MAAATASVLDEGADRRRHSSQPQPQPQQQQQRLHNLYIKNLPDSIDEACLLALFSRHGGAVVSAVVLRGTSTRGGKLRHRFRGGGSGSGSSKDDKNENKSARSAYSSKRCGFVEMATTEGASAAIAALDGRFLELREGKGKEEQPSSSSSSLSSLALSPSLVLLVSDKPLSSFSSEGTHPSNINGGIRVAHALSKDARQQVIASAKAEAAQVAAEEAKLGRARATVDERNRPGRGGWSQRGLSSFSSPRWPPRAGGGGAGADAERWKEKEKE